MLIGLRLLGGVIGAVFVLYGIVRFRRRSASRASFFLALLFGVGLLTLAISPAAAFTVRDWFGLPDDNLTALVSTLVLSTLLLGVIAVAAALRIDRLEAAVDRQALANGLTSLHLSPTTTRHGVVVVIPALNEVENLPSVLASIPSSAAGLPVDTIIADDGSADGTRELVVDSGQSVVSNLVTRGGGAALRLGYLAAARLDPAVIVTMDADGQHDPTELERLVDPILNGEADLVIGSRVLGAHDPASQARRLGVHVFGVFLSMLNGSRLTDVASGYRAFEPAALARLTLREDQFHAGETILLASRHRLRIKEAPITISKRLHGETKKPKDMRYGLHFLRASVRAWLR